MGGGGLLPLKKYTQTVALTPKILKIYTYEKQSFNYEAMGCQRDQEGWGSGEKKIAWGEPAETWANVSVKWEIGVQQGLKIKSSFKIGNWLQVVTDQIPVFEATI